MKIDRRLFHSRLAHRVFIAFALCALVPILIVGGVSYRSVTDQMVNQAVSRLKGASKGLGLSLYERLIFTSAEFSSIPETELVNPPLDAPPTRGVRLRGFHIIDRASIEGIVGGGQPAGSFEQRQREMHLAEGGSIILPLEGDTDQRSVIMARRLDPAGPESVVVAGEVDPAYLWGLDGGNSVPAGAEFCVLENDGRLIHGTFGGCEEAWTAFGGDHAALDESRINAEFTVASENDEGYIAGHWDLFLGARFFASDWVIIVCEPRSSVVQPIERWRVVFPAVVVLASCVVLLLIISAIRKNLDPIDRLREGTIHLADRDFDYQVEIKTGDEFEQLADAFNAMALRLRRQFGALASTGKIHRAILSSFDSSQVVDTAVVGVLDYFDCERAVIAVFDADGERFDLTTVVPGDSAPELHVGRRVSPDLLSDLESVPQGSVLGHDVPVPEALNEALGICTSGLTLGVPVIIRGKIAALIGLGFEKRLGLPEDDLDQLTQLADQFAVAHSNAEMVREVNDFSLGTLEALARAVDAKSPWTAGHSERVMQLAVTIGAAYGLDPFEISKLYRGAMLHDIGKLGISQALLDKKGRLDDTEFDVVRSHTMIGERILEPVGAFSELMPIVTQHHERFDGTGYPLGLAGSAIDIKARILAVADVYDAMTNPRPYRDSVEPGQVVEMIREQSGSQFDPDVVQAFLDVVDSRGGFDNLGVLKRDFAFFTYQNERKKRVWDGKETERGT